MEAKLTREELISMAEGMGIWVEGRSFKLVPAGRGRLRRVRDRTITPAGENILKFAEAVIAETEKRGEI